MGVQLSLTTLVEQLDDQFLERATRAFRHASGLQRDLAPVAELPELTRLEAFQVCSELIASPRVDDAKRARLVLLRRHLARAYVDARSLESNSRLQTFLHSHTFFAAGKTWTPREALREMPRLASREARADLATELSLVFSAQDALMELP